MNIAGLQKMTLLDYPGKVACTVFLQGCNFRCPFCHNSDLLPMAGTPLMDDAKLLAFLEKRVGLLDGVCFTGGEPTLTPGLEDLMARIKALGYCIKLDTNGTRPELLRRLVEETLVDYVAMDIKNSPEAYAATAGMAPELFPRIEESARYLLSGAVDYEFRTTVVDELHTEQSVTQMGLWLGGLLPGVKAKRFFLQAYTHRDSVLSPGLHAPAKEKLLSFQAILAPCADSVELRGVD